MLSPVVASLYVGNLNLKNLSEKNAPRQNLASSGRRIIGDNPGTAVLRAWACFGLFTLPHVEEFQDTCAIGNNPKDKLRFPAVELGVFVDPYFTAFSFVRSGRAVRVRVLFADRVGVSISLGVTLRDGKQLFS